MFRRNPSSLHEEAQYLQSLIINEMAGFHAGLNSPQDQHRLLNFLEHIISTTITPTVTSPAKTYSRTKEDPAILPQVQDTHHSIPESIRPYILSSKQLNELERNARLGDQDALFKYLEILDYQGHLELENLWVVPFTKYPYETDVPDDFIFSRPIPYKLGLRLDDVDEFYAKHHIVTIDPIKGAFVVDIGTMELSDIVSYRIKRYLSISVDDNNIMSAIKFFILETDAILVIDDIGSHFPAAQEIGMLPKNERQSYKYWELAHRENYPNYLKQKPVLTHWPQRFIRQLSIAHFPDRQSDTPYVIIVHLPTGKAFALNGRYDLIDDNVDDATILHAMRYNKQTDQGWLPTGENQRPDWANDCLEQREPSTNFMAYWIAE